VTTFFVFLDFVTVSYDFVQSNTLYSEGVAHFSFTATWRKELGRSSETHVVLLRFRLSLDRAVHKLRLKLLIVNLFVATSLLALQTLSQ